MIHDQAIAIVYLLSNLEICRVEEEKRMMKWKLMGRITNWR
jgi:hypothetical protein